eukprot:m.12625 g.12625  ORF g.12625 m.12625 type:complete len:412 (+) comp5840_c0_seq1:453-1688(+)
MRVISTWVLALGAVLAMCAIAQAQSSCSSQTCPSGQYCNSDRQCSNCVNCWFFYDALGTSSCSMCAEIDSGFDINYSCWQTFDYSQWYSDYTTCFNQMYSSLYSFGFSTKKMCKAVYNFMDCYFDALGTCLDSSSRQQLLNLLNTYSAIGCEFIERAYEISLAFARPTDFYTVTETNLIAYCAEVLEYLGYSSTDISQWCTARYVVLYVDTRRRETTTSTFRIDITMEDYFPPAIASLTGRTFPITYTNDQQTERTVSARAIDASTVEASRSGGGLSGGAIAAIIIVFLLLVACGVGAFVFMRQQGNQRVASDLNAAKPTSTTTTTTTVTASGYPQASLSSTPAQSSQVAPTPPPAYVPQQQPTQYPAQHYPQQQQFAQYPAQQYPQQPQGQPPAFGQPATQPPAFGQTSA